MVGQFHCTVRGRQPLLDLNRVFAPLRVMSPQVRLNYIALPPAGWLAGWLEKHEGTRTQWGVPWVPKNTRVEASDSSHSTDSTSGA